MAETSTGINSQVIPRRVDALLRTQLKRPDLSPKPEETKKHQEKTEGLFGSSKALLEKFGIPEKDAQKLSQTIAEGQWMFDRDFLISNEKERTKVSFRAPRPISESRRKSSKESINFQEIPTAEIQFSLSDMIDSAVRTSGLKKEYVQTIMEGYTGLTRYKDFGLSCIVPAEMPVAVGKTNDNVNFYTQREQILKKMRNPTDVGIIMGGWTSSINFSQEESDGLDRSSGPKNEANLSQQYFWRKSEQGKTGGSIVVTCAGPGMEKNEFADTVTPEDPFGPTDHMLGMSTAFTLFGKSESIQQASFLGHSMSGAAMLDLLQHYSFPDHWKTSILSICPAIADTNAWANAAERVFQKKFSATALLGTISQKGLAWAVSGGMDILDTLAKQIRSPENYPKLAKRLITDIADAYPLMKKYISELATGQLFLPGDKDSMPKLVKKHVKNFTTYTDRSTLTALGSILDLPLDPERLLSRMRQINCAIVTDKDDQMVDAPSMLRQLPPEIPLFALDDGDKGSHYSFKRNERHGRLLLLQQATEQMTAMQYTFLTETLCKSIYERRQKNHFQPITPADVDEVMSSRFNELLMKAHFDFGSEKYDQNRAFIKSFLMTLGNEIHFNTPTDPLLR